MGASGIVFMMIAMASLSGMKNGCIPISLVLVLLLYLGGELIDGITLRDNISQLSHIVGGLCGTALGMSMRK
jgi:membrane associated rhomboid family serine protease